MDTFVNGTLFIVLIVSALKRFTLFKINDLYFIHPFILQAIMMVDLDVDDLDFLLDFPWTTLKIVLIKSN